MPDFPRPFRPTRPPLPPTLDERVATLEANREHHAEDLADLSAKLGTIGASVSKLSTDIALLVQNRDDLAKSRDKWKNFFLTIASSLAIALIIFLATMAWHVQSARLPPINP